MRASALAAVRLMRLEPRLAQAGCTGQTVGAGADQCKWEQISLSGSVGEVLRFTLCVVCDVLCAVSGWAVGARPDQRCWRADIRQRRHVRRRVARRQAARAGPGFR